jgi:hypothetical protein
MTWTARFGKSGIELSGENSTFARLDLLTDAPSLLKFVKSHRFSWALLTLEKFPAGHPVATAIDAVGPQAEATRPDRLASFD